LDVSDEVQHNRATGLAGRFAAARERFGSAVAGATAAAPSVMSGAKARVDAGLADLKKVDRASLGAKVEGWFTPRAADAAAPPPETTRVATEPTPTRRIEVTEPDTTPTARARVTTRRPFITLGLLMTALVTGAILHILTVFAVIAWPRGSAFDRLRRDLEPNVMKVLPVAPSGAMPLPFMSPDMRYALCRYDVANGSVAVSAVLPELGWSLALYTPQGDNFYATPGQDGRIVDATFTINAVGDRVLIPLPGQRRADVDAAQVTSPSREGLVVIRAPIKGSTSLPLIERTLAAARCQGVTRR
jgi:uncharacterized membrane protein